MSKILSRSFIWNNSITHSSVDLFRERQKERIRRMQNNDATPPLAKGHGEDLIPVGVNPGSKSAGGSASPHSPFARKEGKP